MALAGIGVTMLLALAGCGDDSTDSAEPATDACEVVDGTAGGGTPGITVGLTEWSVSPAPAQATKGAVTVEARNNGKETHELVIARGPADQLKVVDGAVDEGQLPPGAFIGEIEGFAPGTACTATFQLAEPGTYSFFCNIVETEPDGTKESHFQQGMVTSVTVS
ncbi:MAG: hypothetical protein QOJ69_663 [Actinomycetota bacterium]|jgi:uncharacterized cupredoxin-like copper-binding protein|nr:hypothetical protein [Actinomycetota bacterium]MEA2842992.1 hypothetical protein [Actinomycetota bacterium]